MTQTLTIPNWHPPKEANAGHSHWSVVHKRRNETAWFVAVSARVAKWKYVEGKVKLTITLVYPRKYKIDADNLYARVKATVDGLKGSFFKDDDTDHLDLSVTAEVVKGVKETRLTLTSASTNGTMG